uniref:Ig-like domain-containing protein n=1 Tax=Crocodylus porosus TaxID=8502 RepID=A0A7M4E2A2_CROPO
MSLCVIVQRIRDREPVNSRGQCFQGGFMVTCGVGRWGRISQGYSVCQDSNIGNILPPSPIAMPVPCGYHSTEEVFADKEKVQTEVKAALKESATLSCEVAQAGTEVKWCKDRKLVTASKKFKVESEGKSRRLVVQEVEKKDAGEYTCEAAGQKLTFKVIVTGGQDIGVC